MGVDVLYVIGMEFDKAHLKAGLTTKTAQRLKAQLKPGWVQRTAVSPMKTESRRQDCAPSSTTTTR